MGFVRGFEVAFLSCFLQYKMFIGVIKKTIDPRVKRGNIGCVVLYFSRPKGLFDKREER